MTPAPLVTIAVPSFNQGHFLEQALNSIVQQECPVELFIMDGGSTDNSIDIIQEWSDRVTGWRSHPDQGQAAAINEGIAQGKAPYVCWLNSDDWLLPGCLTQLVKALEEHPHVPAVYGRAWNIREHDQSRSPIWVEPFNERRLALRCIISQPATLMRRSAWEAIGGVDGSLHMAMDYDLWWRLFKTFGPLKMIDDYIAVNREHADTKTKTQRRLHYQEAMQVIRRHYGSVPLKWWLYQPYAVWFKTYV
ncbi:MAG: glycosyltransferase family 2 protein [Legionellaceae bacterium]|nr:glycosyltransferase family 2 protein [Legionellaceae bacterium]